MQISFCSLWNLNRAKGPAWVRDVLYRPVHRSNSTGRNYPAQAETPSVCYFLLRFLTLMTGVQIECSFCQIPGHTVRSDGEWVAYSPDTGQESREQPGCRDLPSVCTTPQPSCPSDLPHHNWLSKGSTFFLIQSSSISWINVLTEEVNHAGTLTICPSHTPISTHLKNSLLYIFAFLKAWTML